MSRTVRSAERGAAGARRERHAPSPGITLVELLIASGLALILLFGAGRLNISRTLHGRQVQAASLFRVEGGLALATFAKRLEQADRIVLHSTGDPAVSPFNGPANVRFRVPVGSALDDPDTYRWAQYRLVDRDGNGRPETIEFLDDIGRAPNLPDCAVDDKFVGVNGLAIRFVDDSPSPPGGEATSLDTNLLEVRFSMLNPETGNAEVTYTQGVAFRAGSYSNLNTSCPPAGPCDSGAGLAKPGLSDPPAPCP